MLAFALTQPKDAALFSVISGFDAAYAAYNGFQSAIERYWTLQYLMQNDVRELDDGSSEIVIDCEGLEWVTGWVLGMGRHAHIVEPAEARSAMRDRLAQIQL